MANTPYTLKAWQVAQRDLHLEAVHFIPQDIEQALGCQLLHHF